MFFQTTMEEKKILFEKVRASQGKTKLSFKARMRRLWLKGASTTTTIHFPLADDRLENKMTWKTMLGYLDMAQCKVFSQQ